MTPSLTLGLDPAKKKVTACLLDAEGGVAMAPTDFDMNQAGLAALLAGLRPHRAAGARLVVGVEASASLDDNLLAFFASPQARGDGRVEVIRLDAGQVARFSEARPIRGKTDSADARRIARFTLAYAGRLDAFEQDPTALAMARLVNERARLVQDNTALKNQLQDRLVVSFPEFDEVFKNPCSPLALDVLLEAPTAAACARKRAPSLAKMRPGKGAHCLGEKRAERLVALAKNSIASAVTESDGKTIAHLCRRLQLNLERVAEIEDELRAYAQTPDPEPEAETTAVAAPGAGAETTAVAAPGAVAEFGKAAPAPPPSIPRQIRLADSMPGVALVGACAIVLRSRGVARFVSAKAFAAQLGVCPDRQQTGSSKDRGRLTHRGDRVARSTLYLLTQIACMNDPAMAFHKWRHQRKGLEPKQALCACMNRYAKIMWALVRDGADYDPQKAVANAKRHHPDLWITFLAQGQPGLKTKEKEAEKMTLVP